jgi:hypothetical protein
MLVVASACGSGSKNAVSPAPAASARPRSSATLKILEPLPGSSVTEGQVHVKLELTGGQIVPQTSTNLVPDKGHVHLSLDGKLVSMTYGLEQDFPVTPGRHLVQAEFVAMDHAPFNPRVMATAAFTAQ